MGEQVVRNRIVIFNISVEKIDNFMKNMGSICTDLDSGEETD